MAAPISGTLTRLYLARSDKVASQAPTFVAVQRGIADKALHTLNTGKVKGKSVRARFLQE